MQLLPSVLDYAAVALLPGGPTCGSLVHKRCHSNVSRAEQDISSVIRAQHLADDLNMDRPSCCPADSQRTQQAVLPGALAKWWPHTWPSNCTNDPACSAPLHLVIINGAQRVQYVY